MFISSKQQQHNYTTNYNRNDYWKQLMEIYITQSESLPVSLLLGPSSCSIPASLSALLGNL